MPAFDVIILGLGAMGSAAAAALARRGARVLGLDRYAIPNTLGSSHGESRVIRLSYYEHPDYVPLLRSAFALWSELEHDARTPLMHITGGLYMGPPGSAFIRGTLRSAREHDLPHEELDRDAIALRFPQFELPADHVGVHEPRAGFLRPERILAVYADRALRDGAELHGHERALEWRPGDGGVVVVTDRGTYRARKLVLCAGAWTASLVTTAGIALTVTRQTAAWVWPRTPELFEASRMPIWGLDDAEGYFHYGFPLVADRPGLKVARHYQGAATDADSIDRAVGPADEADIRRVLARHLPAADGPILSMSVCMYTNTPDGHFVLDRHPAHPDVTIAAGFSGHGFKFASVVGEIIADLTLDGGTDHPIGFLGLGRLLTPDVRSG